MKKLAGKTAYATGGGRGIGRAVALKLASEGAGGVYLFCCPESNSVSGQTLIVGGGFTN